ncbi:MAG: hypothetical protein LC772_02835, partial [Chloroflexi bacterium]|nr:hypothetical protein [Chloroflexota bacterium]
STEPISPFLRQAAQEYRLIVSDHPRSPVAFDALLRLAANEDDSWDFAAAAVDRLTAKVLDPGRSAEDNRLPGQPVSADPAAHTLASLYADYLLASPGRRRDVLPMLLLHARDQHDGALVDALSAEEAPPGGGAKHHPSEAAVAPPRAPTSETVRVFRDGRPLPGVYAALVDPGRLHSLGDTARLFGSAAASGSTVPRGEMMQTLQQLNPVRPDDPLQSSGVVLISSLLASQVVKRLHVEQTGPSGAAFFGQDIAGAVGAALLLDEAGSEPDSSLARGDTGDIQLAPRVRLSAPILSARKPPLLRWFPYPGAAKYSAVVALESPAPPRGRSVAVGPDWDRHVTWWRDGITGASIRLDPGGFVGPADSLVGNGLWSRAIYRVIVTAEDASGRPLSSSLGLKDHPEEFFTLPANWLGLRSKGAKVAARAEDLEIPGFGGVKRALSRLRRHPGPGPSPLREPLHTDPLEQVIELARSLHPTTLPGVSVSEPDLVPVDPYSPEAAPLARWPALATGGQGKIPLSSPFLGGLLSAAFGNG